MSVCLCTLALGEMEWLPKLYAQLRDFPELSRWVFVEAADAAFAEVNPDRVTAAGLSTDGTSDFLRDLARADERVVYIPHGFSRNPDVSQGKCEARQRYLDEAEKVRPEFLFCVDADETYIHADQQRLLDVMRAHPDRRAISFPIRHPWRPPSIADRPLFQLEVVGGFWAMAHCHWWRWQPGLRYGSSHNSPEGPDGRPLNTDCLYLHHDLSQPACIHMAFSSSEASRQAKHRYYVARGEGQSDRRGWYVQSRAAWETWEPGWRLPRGARVQGWRGEIPECFREEH